MEFQELQKQIVENAQQYGRDFNVKIDRDFAVLKLVEEVGELAEAILTYERKSRPEKLIPPEEAQKRLAHEVADVLGMAIVIADTLNVDLEKALQQKWLKKKTA